MTMSQSARKLPVALSCSLLSQRKKRHISSNHFLKKAFVPVMEAALLFFRSGENGRADSGKDATVESWAEQAP